MWVVENGDSTAISTDLPWYSWKVTLETSASVTWIVFRLLHQPFRHVMFRSCCVQPKFLVDQIAKCNGFHRAVLSM
jgi:hypothetical protein